MHLILIDSFSMFFLTIYISNISRSETITSLRIFLTFGHQRCSCSCIFSITSCLLDQIYYFINIKLMHCKLVQAYYIAINVFICAVISSLDACLNETASSRWILMLLNWTVNNMIYNNSHLCLRFVMKRSKTGFGNHILKF